MRKKISLSIISFAIVILVLCAFSPTANAATVDFSVDVGPREFLTAGSANITFSVMSDADMSGISVYKAGTKVGGFDSALANERKQDTATISVSEDEINAGKLNFSVTYSGGDGAGSKTASVSISRKAPTVSVETSYRVDRKYGPEGTRIGLVFFIKNTGGKTLSDVKVREGAINGGAWMGGITIKPGELRMITAKHTIVRDETLTPKLSYSDGGKTYETSFGDTKLLVTKGDVKVTIESDKTTATAGEEVSITVRILNESNVYLRDLKLYDHNNVLVPLKGDVLRQNEAVSAVVTATFRESDSVQFDITAKDYYKSVYSYASNIIDIKVPIQFNLDDLEISAESEYTSLAEPGLATFNVLLTNKSFYSLNDVKIIDLTTGEILSEIPHLEKGERLVRVKTQVDKSKDVSFKVEASDADGNVHEKTTSDSPINISILSEEKEEEPTLSPTPSPTPEVVEEPSGKLSVWVLSLIGVSVLILGVIIALSAVISSAKKGGGGKPPKAKPTPKPRKPKAPKPSPQRNTVPKKRPGAPKKKKKSNIKVTYRR